LPKFMPPSARGETRTAAVGLSSRCLPSRETGLAGVIKDIFAAGHNV
jgi:hypothetical protein